MPNLRREIAYHKAMAPGDRRPCTPGVIPGNPSKPIRNCDLNLVTLIKYDRSSLPTSHSRRRLVFYVPPFRWRLGRSLPYFYRAEDAREIAGQSSKGFIKPFTGSIAGSLPSASHGLLVYLCSVFEIAKGHFRVQVPNQNFPLLLREPRHGVVKTCITSTQVGKPPFLK